MSKFLTALVMSAAILGATPLTINSPLEILESFRYQTPTGRQMKISKKTKLVIVAFEKDTGALVNEYLDTQSPFRPPRYGTVYHPVASPVPDHESRVQP